MRSPIEEAFHGARQEGRCAFIPYMTGGFPDRETCIEILTALGRSGADLVEIGIPFSDPLADGPTIQWSSREALDAGTTPAVVFGIVERAAAEMRAPVVLMTYWNPVLRMGPEAFAARAKDAGACGVIVPDLPPEEGDVWVEAAWRMGLDTIFMAAPTTPVARLDRIIPLSRGFIYYVSMTGVTGSRLDVSREVLDSIKRIKARTQLPVAVGFGISTPAQARAFSEVADGVIVGSALIQKIRAQGDRTAQLEAVCRFASSITQALWVNGAVRSP